MTGVLATLEDLCLWLIWLAGVLTGVVISVLVVERTTIMLRSLLR